MTDLWNYEEPIAEYDETFEVPEWISQDISPCDVASICQGGCASGAYMPAVTYHEASETMSKHGNDVLQFIQDHHGELPQPKPDESWSGLAVLYLSVAVETWAFAAQGELENTLTEDAA